MELYRAEVYQNLEAMYQSMIHSGNKLLFTPKAGELMDKLPPDLQKRIIQGDKDSQGAPIGRLEVLKNVIQEEASKLEGTDKKIQKTVQQQLNHLKEGAKRNKSLYSPEIYQTLEDMRQSMIQSKHKLLFTPEAGELMGKLPLDLQQRIMNANKDSEASPKGRLKVLEDVIKEEDAKLEELDKKSLGETQSQLNQLKQAAKNLDVEGSGSQGPSDSE